MPDIDLDAIEARANAATTGPWHHGTWNGVCRRSEHGATKHPGPPACQYTYQLSPRDGHVAGPEPVQLVGSDDYGPILGKEDAEFIVHARADVPALVAEVRRLRAEVAAEQSRYAKLAHHFDAAVLAQLAATRHAHALKAEVDGLKHTRTVGAAPVIGPEAVRYRFEGPAPLLPYPED